MPRKKIVKGLKQFLETLELQILGSLHKMKGGNWKEGEKNIEAVARKCKATCKSIKIKLENLEKQMIRTEKSQGRIKRRSTPVSKSRGEFLG